jgi:hypothetical protein
MSKRLPHEIANVAALGRVAGWSIDCQTADCIVIGLPSGHLSVFRRHPPAPPGWGIMVAFSVADLDAVDAFDAASALAELIASRAVWQLHQVADGKPRLVGRPVAGSA